MKSKQNLKVDSNNTVGQEQRRVSCTANQIHIVVLAMLQVLIHMVFHDSSCDRPIHPLY